MSSGFTAKAEGAGAERRAAEYLEQNGVRILERNFRTRRGEIDLIGLQNGVLLFIEVKYRNTSHSGSGYEGVTLYKRKKICACALYYLWRKGLGTDVPVRFDVISMQQKDILWIQDAFPYTEPGRRASFSVRR